jgi:hypothetical protein
MKMAMVKVRGRQQVSDSKSLRNMEPSVRFARSRIRTCSRRRTFEASAKRDLTTGEMAFSLCSTHHDAYDAQLFAIHPDTLSIVAAPDISPADIGLDGDALALKQRRPHRGRSHLALRVDPE